MRGHSETPRAYPILRGTLPSSSHQPAVIFGLTYEAPEMDLRSTCKDPARQSPIAARARRLITGIRDAPGPSPGSDAGHSAARISSPSARRADAHHHAAPPRRAEARGLLRHHNRPGTAPASRGPL
jgi:hypothetical protein